MPLLKERGHPWYWNEAFLVEIFCWIKPKSKSDIRAHSNKKAMLDARLMCLISDGRDSRQQFKKMRAYWKTFRLTNLIHYNNYLDYRWRGRGATCEVFSLAKWGIDIRHQLMHNSDKAIIKLYLQFLQIYTTLELYLFKLRGRMVLCTIKILLRIDKAFKTIVFCLPAACSNLHACLHLIYC